MRQAVGLSPMPKARNIVQLPVSRPALRAELERLDRELERTSTKRARRVLAIERRRVVVELDRIGAPAE